MEAKWNKVEKKGNGTSGDFNDINWKCEDLPELEGTLTGIKKGVGVHSQTVFSIETEDGTEYNVWETTVLKRLFEDVEIGSYVKIVYIGKKKSKNGLAHYKDFDVFIAEGIEEPALTTEEQASEVKPQETVTETSTVDESDEVPF